jgi:hypothetical protein
VVGVLADDGLQAPAAEEIGFALAQVQDDVGAALRTGDRLDLEVAGALAAPAHALLGLQARAAGFDGDAVGDDVAAVEAHAELADELGVLLLVAREAVHELAGAALGDGAEVGNGLLGRQADAVVADGEGASVLVEAHAHFEVGLVFVERVVIQGLEAQLVAGVRGIRDQLAQEDFLVRVQRVGDEVEQLLDFGLE